MDRITVRSADDLKRLIEEQKLRFLLRNGPEITVELPWLPPHESERWANILTRHVYQCGCNHGAAFLFAGCVILLARFVTYGFRPFGLWYVMVGPLFLIVLSGMGKALGILWSRIRLRWSIGRLLAMSPVEPGAAHGPSDAPSTRSALLHHVGRQAR
jgi:hypothetical protein